MCKINISIHMLSKEFFDKGSNKKTSRDLMLTLSNISSTSEQSECTFMRTNKPTPEEIRSNRSQIQQRLSLSFPNMKSVNCALDQKGLVSTASSLKQIIKRDKFNFKFFTEKRLDEVEEIFFNYSEESMTFIKQDFNSKYELMNKIGEGAHSSVYKCKNTDTCQLFAVKITRKVDQQLKNRMVKQYKLLKILNHPHVLKVHELIFHEQEQKLYIISQLCEYPDLRHQIICRKQSNLIFQEKQIFQLLQKFLQTLNYLHASGISHRDIKPENILYNPQTKQIKIIDFDVSKEKFFKNQDFFMWTNTGTLHYRAPETFSLGYSQKIDIWSAGIMLYQLIVGSTPFNSIYERETIRKIKTQKIDLDQLKRKFSSKLVFLISKMLQKQSKFRYSCCQCLNFLNKNQKHLSKDDNYLSYLSNKNNQDVFHNQYFDTQSIEQMCITYQIKMDYVKWSINMNSNFANSSSL